MLMSTSVVLALLVKKAPVVSTVLIGFLFAVTGLLDAIILFDLFGTVNRVYADASNTDLSTVFSTHRFLLIQVPALLSFLAFVLAFVCKGHELKPHAKMYVTAMQVCVIVSFCTVLLIGYESLI